MIKVHKLFNCKRVYRYISYFLIFFCDLPGDSVAPPLPVTSPQSCPNILVGSCCIAICCFKRAFSSGSKPSIILLQNKTKNEKCEGNIVQILLRFYLRHEIHQDDRKEHHEHHRILDNGGERKRSLCFKIFEGSKSRKDKWMRNRHFRCSWESILKARRVLHVVFQELTLDLWEQIDLTVYIENMHTRTDIIKYKRSVGAGICLIFIVIDRNGSCLIEGTFVGELQSALNEPQRCPLLVTKDM